MMEAAENLRHAGGTVIAVYEPVLQPRAAQVLVALVDDEISILPLEPLAEDDAHHEARVSGAQARDAERTTVAKRPLGDFIVRVELGGGRLCNVVLAREDAGDGSGARVGSMLSFERDLVPVRRCCRQDGHGVDEWMRKPEQR